MEFYHNIAEVYDDMTRFEQRVEKERLTMQKWVQRYHIESAIDVACGTGLHAIILSQLGVRTVGTDISEEMLAKAKVNARRAQQAIRRAQQAIHWVQAPMQQLRQLTDGSYDAVFCLGNSIPHLLSKQDLCTTINNFYELLNPEGTAIIQLLNYKRVLTNKERIVGIHRMGNREYIRFYDFMRRKIRFNILVVTQDGDKISHFLSSTILCPYKKAELESALMDSGFCDLEFWGDMQFQPFQANTSANLVIVAKKVRHKPGSTSK